MDEQSKDPRDLLPEIDRDFLSSKELPYEVESASGVLLIIIKDYPFPPAYTPAKADLMIILPSGYPNAELDMFWTSPDVKLANGNWPAASDYHQPFNNKNWQRWSRHKKVPWRLGVDSLRTYLASVRVEINRGI